MTGRIIDSFPQTARSHARLIRLGLMARIFSGGTPDKTNPDYWENGELPWIGSGEVNQSRITQPTTYITHAAVRGSATKLFPAGSVAMALAGQGKTKAMVATMGIDAYGNQSLACIADYKGNNKFLYWWLTSLYKEIRGLSSEDTRDGLNQSMVGQIPVPNYSYEFQTTIADFLDRETTRIDLLIEKKQRLAELLKEKLRAEISRMFDNLVQDSVPTRRLRHLLIEPLKYGANEAADSDDPEGVRFIRITDLKADGSLRENTFKSLPADKATPYLLRFGDVLLARSGATVGKSFIYRDEFGPCCFAGYLIRARLQKRLIEPEFFKRYTETRTYWDFIALSNIQATIQNVSAEKYANLAIPLPGLAEQKVILDKLTRLEAPLTQLLKRIDHSIEGLKVFRSALITAAVTGQIHVGTWSKKGSTDARLDQIEADTAKEARA